ncbi:hypothetical protein PMKS-001979 [Pichia membranifaciens]|uniref:RlpA-like protein double-psi beta-barrel domain-containing protein n=1 Tax=Pichia membranifaciens TaxID=4926 RepID=A0A1Q2YG65_9ASCO|nr:hypothetical protein PMKS-001979 [Pichia membranifaciens]
MTSLKSLFLAIALLPAIQAAPVAEAHTVYKTVTVFESVTVPYGPASSSFATGYKAASPSDDCDDDDDSDYPVASASASAAPSIAQTYANSSASAAPSIAETYANISASAAPSIAQTYAISSASASASVSPSVAEKDATTSIAGSSATSSSIFDTSAVQNGIATFYSVGADNCGTSSTDSDYVCAISQKMYDSVASSESISEYCGHSININYNGKTITVKVVDSCESCDATHLDLSPSAFQALADPDLGVIDIQWEWA